MRLACAVVAFAMASCASTIDKDSTAHSGAEPQAKPLFLRDPGTPPPPGMLPTPYIGRATEGVLSVDKSGCVYVTGPAGESLIIWPPDAVFEPRDSTFQTKRSGVLRFGDRLSFRGNPVGPLKVSVIGNVHVPEVCRRMPTLFVAPDGARKHFLK